MRVLTALACVDQSAWTMCSTVSVIDHLVAHLSASIHHSSSGTASVLTAALTQVQQTASLWYVCCSIVLQQWHAKWHRGNKGCSRVHTSCSELGHRTVGSVTNLCRTSQTNSSALQDDGSSLYK